MYISKLKIFGFKSFCDKLEVTFDRGITCVVGPNGCGKTNIVDAIRWVLGEQKTSLMRGDSMSDLIFSGTTRRQPLNMAEVSMVIQNEDGVLPVEYAEVMVTRRVYRSGEGEYRLNKVPCRLKDIQGLFSDTGLGASIYTTIEGKMIDAILSDKADERRVLFEEAAGISKYKKQRVESLRQLERTTQDLVRINDKVEEIGRNLKILERHEQKARKYKEYFEKLKALEISFENHTYTETRKKLGEVETRLSALDSERAGMLAKRDTARTSVEGANLNALQKENALQAAQEKVNQLNQALTTNDRDQSVARERIKSFETSLERIQNETASLDTHIAETEKMRAAIERSRVEHQTQLEAANQELSQKAAQFDAFVQELSARRNEAARLSQEHTAVLDQSTGRQRKVAEVQAQVHHIQDRLRAIEMENAGLEQRLHELEDEAQSAKSLAEAASEESRHLAESRETLLRRIEEQENVYRQVVDKEKGLEAQMLAGKKQLDFLESLNVTYEGYAAGTKAIMEAQSQIPGIRGILADKVKIKHPYIRAIESFLGQKAQTIIMGNLGEASSAISFLENGNLGRATLLALDRVSEKSFPDLPAEMMNEPGVLARGSDCVEIEAALMPLIHHLLDYVVIVQDRPTADALARKWANRRIWFVTPEGECHATSGFITGGRTGKTEIGLISRKQQIEKLRTDNVDLTARIADKTKEREACIATRDEARMALIEADEKLNAGRRTLHEQESNLKHLDQRIISIHDRRAKLDEETAFSNARIAELSLQAEQLGQELTQLQGRREAIDQGIAAISRELEGRETERSRLQADLHQKELELAGLRNKIDQQSSDAERLGTELKQAEEEKVRKQEELASCRDGAEEMRQSLVNFRQAMDSLVARRQELEKERDRAREDYNAVLARVDAMRQDEKTCSVELERLQQEFHNLEMEKTRDEERSRRIRERMWEAYEIDLNSPPAELPAAEWKPETVHEEIAMYKERIKRVGQVNMAALEDYESEKKRFEDLAGQRDDLLQAKDSLEKAIKKLDRTAREQFLATFSQVQTNFREVFVSLFEGGEATVTLEPDKDPLEAKIEINARPTGKAMRGVQLLSGGERALTAISLLFALYLTRPSPYCLMDEVDAPLDEANIGRFVGLLKKFSTRTQFIIVTHNKVTMEAADRLYGVTMEERGISRLVSVKFEEAEALAA